MVVRALGILGVGALLLACGADSLTEARPPTSQEVDSVTLVDERDDLWVAFSDHRAPVVPNGDVLGAEVSRSSTVLTVTMQYVDIEPRANIQWSIYFVLETGRGIRWEVIWSESQLADAQEWRRSIDITRMNAEDPLGSGCRGLRARADFAEETVTVIVPDRCFGSPRWVVVHDLEATSHPSRGSGQSEYVDNPSTDSPRAEDTPRLVAGS